MVLLFFFYVAYQYTLNLPLMWKAEFIKRTTYFTVDHYYFGGGLFAWILCFFDCQLISIFERSSPSVMQHFGVAGSFRYRTSTVYSLNRAF